MVVRGPSSGSVDKHSVPAQHKTWPGCTKHRCIWIDLQDSYQSTFNTDKYDVFESSMPAQAI